MKAPQNKHTSVGQILLGSLFLLSASFTAGSRCSANTFGTVIPDTSLSTNIFDKASPGGLALCARECKYRRRCKSFNYMDAIDECQLNAEVLTGSGENTTGLSYSNINTWPETIGSTCANDVCTDLEKCVPGPTGYTCQTIYYNVVQQTNTALIGKIFDTVTAGTETACADACHSRTVCVSFNYKSSSNRCELNTETMLTDYISYIGNQLGSFYSNVDQYTPVSIVI
ncbi:hypothetical protein SNE40_001063 [Patella caerulea]